MCQRSKRCPGCNRDLPTDQFGKNRARKDGVQVYCRTCWSAKRSDRYASSPAIRERHLASSKAWYQRRSQSFDKRRRAYRKANAESINAKGRVYHHANRTSVTKRQKAWYKANREAKLVKNRAWAASNIESRRIRKARRRALERAATTAAFTTEQLAQRWAYYGNRCWICRAPATATDHVKPLAKGGAHMLCNLRPICQPCNSTKNATWPLGLLHG